MTNINPLSMVISTEGKNLSGHSVEDGKFLENK